MKKITLLFMLMFGFSSLLSAQCLTSDNGQWPSSTYTIATCDGLTQNNITTCGYASEYSVVTVTQGETYTFGSSVTTDIVTLSTDSGATAETTGTGSVTWVATVSGDIYFYTHLDDGACGGEQVCRTRYVICGTPPTCIAPTGVVVSNITTTSATISWNTSVTDPGNGYEYYLSTTNTAPLTTDTATGAVGAGTTTVDLPLLTTATTYYVWVRSVCSSTDSSAWSSMATFATLCNAVTDFSENFDAAVEFPVCWARVGTGGNTYVQASASAPSQPNNLYLYGSSATSQGIVSMIPVSNAGDNTHRLRFKARGNFTLGGNIEVGYLTNPSDATSFVAVQTFTTTSTTVYDQFVAYLGTAPGTNQVLAFRHTGVPGYSVLIDDVIWEPSPACVEPVNVAYSALTDSTVTLSWGVPPVAPVSYEYVLDTNASDPTTSGTVTNALSYDANSLTPLTTYYFHVRSNCGSGSDSVWVTISFTTFATPPANDLCSNAITLTPGGVFADNAVSGTLYGATTTAGITPSCQSLSNSDVWYTVQVPASGSLTIETQVASSNSISDSIVAAFTGTCGSLTQIGCDDDGGPAGANNLMSLLSLTGLTPNDTIYIGVWKYSSVPTTSARDFMISAYDASLSSNVFSSEGFTFYPNPVKDVLTISNNTSITKIQVINLLGQEMIVKANNDVQGQVDMSSLAAGTYLVKVTANDQIKTIKVVKE
ncbi:T9SS type A sorting domain-containing protein [Flavobacterium aciduliphilum]|uniref:Putative secreted protein (Por secretion system target) n=1 Tax=Flavobacterium aciduliphilum TaxID=1101402 RepID=A0A328YTD2_9FLAO|nr:T9SS type A sorting domain-containing protein [Flavobacterium aciduliphilum]RAR75442.1 putative secreted protein (Por secretion system target) [Flavobacterium aciduliphilum]